MNGDNYASRESGRSRDYHSSRHDRDRTDRRERDRGERGDRDRRDRGADRGTERGDRDRGERRRSRSPHHRSSRRDHEDSYSTSRDYRAREREDRYSNRREERDWDRDRGPRRRDDDRRRGDRDLFEDRRGGGRGDRNDRGDRGDRGAREDRDEFAAQARGRRSSPQPPKKREPTPDLTDTISVLNRKRRMTQWDIKPPGYENVTAEQAKLSGMFPLPGAPRQQMDPSRLQAFINQPQGGADSAVLKTSNARQSKRLFAYNIPSSATEQSIVAFFNLQLNGLNVVKTLDPCVSASITEDHSFALLEFKSPDDTTTALAMNGITMEEHITEANGSTNGTVKGLDLKRPKDYIVPTAESDVSMDGGISSEVPDTEGKICVTNIPTQLEESQVIELLQAFGELKAFVLVKDNGSGESRGIAFVEYAASEATPIAVESLNEIEFPPDSKLKANLASIGFKQAAGLELGVNAMSMFAGTTTDNLEESRVLCLLNMVTAEELIDNDEYEEICEDVREECSKYGTIVDLKIPRPAGGSRQSAGVGKIFIKFDTTDSSKKALQSLAGRKFADRTVVTSYFDESSFDVNAW